MESMSKDNVVGVDLEPMCSLLSINAQNGPGGPPAIRFMIRIDIHRTKLNIILKKENFHLVTIGK